MNRLAVVALLALCAALPARTLAVERIPTRPERDPLDRDLAVQQLILAAPDLTHAAGRDAVGQPVSPGQQVVTHFCPRYAWYASMTFTAMGAAAEAP